MSVQVKKNTKKNKVSPNDDQLQATFFQPQRVKTSRAAKPNENYKFSMSQEANEALEAAQIFSKESIPYIDKQIFIENSLDRKDTAPTTSEAKEDGDDGNGQCVENKISIEDKQKPIDVTTILSDQYIPVKHLFREKESQEILNFIAKCVKNDCYDSLMIYGSPGTGKTTVLSYIMKKLEKHGLRYVGQKKHMGDELEWVDCTGEVSVINLDSGHKDGLSNLIVEIIRAVDGKIPLSIGEYVTSVKLLTEKLKQLVMTKKSKKLVVVVLDEIDKMLNKVNLIKEIMELLRVSRYPSSNIIFIATTNIPDLLSKLSDQHKATIEISHIVFEPYSLEAMISVLKNRFELIGSPDGQDSQCTINENPFQQIDLEACVREMPNLKETDIRHVLRVLRKAYSDKVRAPMILEEECGEVKQPASQTQIAKDDIMSAYKELYDDWLTGIVALMAQKYLMGLVGIIMVIAKKGTDIFSKKDLLAMYNNICGKLFLPRADMTSLGEILTLYENYKIVEVKPKENEAPPKKSPIKTPVKNEEYAILVSPGRIKLTLLQDGLFSKYFEE